MLRAFRLAAVGFAGLGAVLAWACTGDDPPPSVGSDGGSSGSSGGPNDGAPGDLPRGLVGLTALHGFDETPWTLPPPDGGEPGIPVVAMNPSGDLVTGRTSPTNGEAKLEIVQGATVSARIELAGQPTRIVTYANVAPGDGLRVELVPFYPSDHVLPTVAPVNGVADAGEYGLSLCQRVSSYYSVVPNAASPPNIGTRDTPCRTKDKTPITFLVRPTPQSEPTHMFFTRVTAGPSASVNVRGTDWRATRDVYLALRSPLETPNVQGATAVFRGAYLVDETMVYEDAHDLGRGPIPAGSRPIPGILDTGGSIESVDEWERSILATGRRGVAASFQTGSVVRERINTASDDPAQNLPLVQTVTLSGTADKPVLNFTPDAPLTDITGVEVLLSDYDGELEGNPNLPRANRHWLIRMTVANPTSPLALPQVPAPFADLVPPAWKHVQVLFVRNESFPDPAVFRGVPARLAPPNFSRRLTQRLRFPTDTKLRVSAVQTAL